MNWIDVAGLAIGLGVGTFGGWLTRRAAPSADRSDRSEQLAVQALTATEQLQRIRLAYQMATDMGQFKAGFLARTAHELRSPLNRVISLHQLILNGLCDNPEEEKEFMVQSYAAAEQMLALLDQMIGVSKIVHGSAQSVVQSVDLRETLSNIEYLTQLQAKNRNLKLVIELPEEGVYVAADPRWLEQVLLSLVDTPLSLMQEGQVRVSLETIAPQVQIVIEDERPASFWYEPIDLLAQMEQGRSAALAQDDFVDFELIHHDSCNSDRLDDPMDGVESGLSPGLSLLSTQVLVEVMGGDLQVLAVPILPESDRKSQSGSQSGSQSEFQTGLSQITRIRLSLAKA